MHGTKYEWFKTGKIETASEIVKSEIAKLLAARKTFWTT